MPKNQLYNRFFAFVFFQKMENEDILEKNPVISSLADACCPGPCFFEM